MMNLKNLSPLITRRQVNLVNSMEIFYVIVLIATWFMCSRCTWRKLTLSKSPAINPETLAVHGGMLTIGVFFIWGTLNPNINALLPLVSTIAILIVFYATETNSEGFWRKRRNQFFGAGLLFCGVFAAQVAGCPALVISGLLLLCCIHKVQFTLGQFYRQQIKDFEGVKEKLFFLESSLRNQELIESSHESQPLPTRLDKAV